MGAEVRLYVKRRGLHPAGEWSGDTIEGYFKASDAEVLENAMRLLIERAKRHPEGGEMRSVYNSAIGVLTLEAATKGDGT